MANVENKINFALDNQKENNYELALQKKEFFDRVSNKFTAHTKLLTNYKNFNHMLKELHRMNDYFNIMLDNFNNRDFDFVEYEKNFDKLIDEDIAVIENRTNWSN
jgi:hypothetical protein